MLDDVATLRQHAEALCDAAEQLRATGAELRAASRRLRAMSAGPYAHSAVERYRQRLHARYGGDQHAPFLE
jgi:hypothetical protein